LLHPQRHAGASVSQWIAGAGFEPAAAAAVNALVRLTTYASDVHIFAADAAVAQLQRAANAATATWQAGRLSSAAAGAILSAGDVIEQVMAVTSKDGVVTSVYFVGNPDKLTSVGRPPFIE
jgi:hypothetical protein